MLTPERVAEIVVDRRYRFASDEAIAVGELLISMDPESVAEAERVETRLILLDIFREDPVDQFERLTGIKLDLDDEEGGEPVEA